MKTCFIIMPLTTPDLYLETYKGDKQHFIHVLDHLFKPAVEAVGLQTITSSLGGSEIIHDEIIKNLATADLVLCDVSVSNPKVFFELGVRMTLNKPVAMVKDDCTDNTPFDLSQMNYYRYDSSLSAWVVGEEINRLKEYLASSISRSSVFGDPLVFNASIPQDAPNSPFTSEEINRISNALKILSVKVQETLELQPDHIRFLESKLGYLEEATKRQGRVDWMNLSVGVLLNIAIVLAFDPVKASLLWDYFRATVGSALGNLLGLPPN